MLKSALEDHPKLRHTVIYSNKSWDDVIYRDALAALAEKDPDRIKVVHTLTREERASVYGPSVRKGRISGALLREFIPSPNEPSRLRPDRGSQFGREAARETGTTPQPRFLEAVLAALKEIGVPANRIKRECYG
jgi:ferredoxin-NADP reductase